MEFDFPSVIIDLNSSTTKAGISTFDTPTLSLPSVYSKHSSSEDSPYVFGDNLDSHPANDIYTMFNEGLIYNWDAMTNYWRHIYSELHLKDTSELPLIITENAWNTKKNRTKAVQVAFEELEVPIFSILKRQICTAYSVSRPSAVVVVDIDEDLVSVTPISNGKVLNKGIQRTKFGGDFLSLFSLDYIQKHYPEKDADIDEALIPRQFKSTSGMSESFKRYQISATLKEFRESILSTSLMKIDPHQTEMPQETQIFLSHTALGQMETKHFELPNRETIKDIGIDQFKLADPLFRPYEYSKVLPQKLNLSQDSLGLANLVFNSMKNLGGSGDLYLKLLNNIVLTGSATNIPNIEQRLAQDLRMFIQDYSIATFLSPDLIDRNNDVWIGANILASSSIGDFDNLFMSKEEYNENGEDYALEKFK
ncbi:unnamed protein product [Ambrosiozyma monospora]|uniref:Unnamed protein product n=1 Tax=Ambrosiozyma monospora TaxID=43982 RepID=A0ACB5SXQ2_AMBMO|nr:unnamed protein product [Ambrosiozyma monospora]